MTSFATDGRIVDLGFGNKSFGVRWQGLNGLVDMNASSPTRREGLVGGLEASAYQPEFARSKAEALAHLPVDNAVQIVRWITVQSGETDLSSESTNEELLDILEINRKDLRPSEPEKVQVSIEDGS